MGVPVNRSEWLAVAALVFGALVAWGVYAVFPNWPWWAYVVIAFLVGGPAYRVWLEMVANEKVIDRGDWPKKEG